MKIGFLHHPELVEISRLVEIFDLTLIKPTFLKKTKIKFLFLKPNHCF